MMSEKFSFASHLNANVKCSLGECAVFPTFFKIEIKIHSIIPTQIQESFSFRERKTRKQIAHKRYKGVSIDLYTFRHIDDVGGGNSRGEFRALKNFNINMKYLQKYRSSQRHTIECPFDFSLNWEIYRKKKKRRPSLNSIKWFSSLSISLFPSRVCFYIDEFFNLLHVNDVIFNLN